MTVNVQDSPEILHKCLLIAHKLYSNLKMQKLGPVLLTLLETLVCYIILYYIIYIILMVVLL